MGTWRAVGAGTAVQVSGVVLGVIVPLSTDVMWVAALLMLNVGLAGGYAAGRLSEDGWRTGARNGLVSGLIGGVVFAVTLWATMGNVIDRASHSVFWGLNYAIAVTLGPLLGPLAARVDPYVPIVFGALGAGFMMAEGWIAGAAAPRRSTPPSPPTEQR